MASIPWSEAEVVALLNKNMPYHAMVHLPVFKGNRTVDALRCKRNKLLNYQRLDTALEHARIGVLDIETTNLKANIGFMLSWAMYYPQENKTTHAVVTKADITNLRRDKRVCKKLVKELAGVDLLITYNGTRFDIPYARTRCLMNGLGFPEYGEMQHIDCYYFARGKVATHRKSLDAISIALGCGGKTAIDISVWADAGLGDKTALDEVLHHNLIDVKVTWDVYNQLKKFGRYAPKSI